MLAASVATAVAGGCTSGPPRPLAPVNPDALEGTSVAGALPDSLGLTPQATSSATPAPEVRPTAYNTPPEPLTMPFGFTASVFASELGPASGLAYAPNGDLFVSVPWEDREEQILVLPDRDGNGLADERRVFAEGADLHLPYGIRFHGDYIYIANTDRIIRYPYYAGELAVRDAPEVVVDNVPGLELHWARPIAFGPDERLYVGIGSSCNACIEADPLRSTVLRFLTGGSPGERVARGLRNPAGLAFHPVTGELWVTESGRDGLGDDLPPDELNQVVQGGDYGWPFCFGRQAPDPELSADDPARCAQTAPSALDLPAHVAVSGLTFYEGAQFPEDYLHDAFIAYHGSGGQTTPRGYKVVRVPFENGRPAGQPEDFVSGWLRGDLQRWGRPVDVITAPDGALMISDDRAGIIYRVVYAPPVPTPTRWR
jgi:glucose/arabinose dehydrogenase